MMINKNDLLYFCSIVEYIARITKNERRDIINKLTIHDIEHELYLAEVNHCLSFEQVSDEWVEKYNITEGKYDSIGICKYKVPSYTAIGKVYCNLILDVLDDENNFIKTIKDVFNSKLVEEISFFNSNVFYSNSDYLKESYLANNLL